MAKESILSQDWFRKGEIDLRAAETLLNAQNLEAGSFHIQQAIEKYLKGYLVGKGWHLKRTHDLIDLLNEVIFYESGLESFRDLCMKATEFYIEDRYPFAVNSELNENELRTILKKAKDLIQKVVSLNREEKE